MSGFSFDIVDQRERKYQLSPNDLYEYPAQSSIQPLETCPLTSEIKVVAAPWSSGDVFTFDTVIGRTQFVSNCFKFHFTLPIEVTLTTAGAVDIDASNYMTELLKNNDSICYSERSIIQALQNVTVRINDKDLTLINNISETFNIISPYYAASDVDEYFHASQPDRFQSFETYNATTNQTLEYIDVNNTKVKTTVAVLNDDNPFNSSYKKGYISRTPQWSWLEPGGNKKKSAILNCSFFCYLPLSIGTIPSSMTALSGINRLGFTFHFKPNAAHYLFNMKKASPPGTGYIWSDFSVNTGGSRGSNIKAKMLTQIYSAPQYMRERMMSPINTMQPYSISCPRITTHISDALEIVAPAEGTTAVLPVSFSHSGYKSGSVPSSIYVAIVKDKVSGFEGTVTTPINFGLIQNLTISVDSAVTAFNDILSLDYLTASNGYDGLDPIGKLCKGFPVRLKVGKDLSLPGDLVVGQAYDFNFSVSGSFVNQEGKPAKYRLVVTVVNDATLDFDGTEFSHSSGVLVPQAMLSDGYFIKNQYSNYQRKFEVLGGGVFGDAMRWFGKNAVKLAKNAWENRDKIASTVGDVAQLVKTVRGGKTYGNVSGGTGGVNTLGAGKLSTSIFR